VSEPTFVIEFDVGKTIKEAVVSARAYKLNKAGPNIPVGPVVPD
jgi:hypothetical protein